MRLNSTDTTDLKLFDTEVFSDNRGFFMESFSRKKFHEKTGIDADFVQENHSRSSCGVLRGLHYQLNPHGQGKLLRVVRGAIFDVCVDIRRSSPNYGNWFGIHLSEQCGTQIWIPEGFAHGFLALSDSVDLIYKTTDYWHKDLERSIRWDCPEIGVEWPTANSPILSQRDRSAVSLSSAEIFP